MQIKGYQRFLYEKRALKKLLEDRCVVLEDEKSGLGNKLEHLGEAREVVSKVGILAQQEVKDIVEDLVTQALQVVFGSSYSFEMEDKIQRNKPETYFYLKIGDRRNLLKDDLEGGGVVDLVSFGLRVVLWAISTPRTASVIMLDEPVKYIDKVRLEQTGVMIKKLSEMLGLQFIIVTHEDQLIDVADCGYHVEKIEGISRVRKVV